MLLFAAVVLSGLSLFAQAKPTPPEEPAPVSTKHEITVNGKALKYTATTGRLPIKNEQDQVDAHMFFVSYTLDIEAPAKSRRPLMISFNGGPGSSSVWLHMGALGPKRVPMKDNGEYPPPPFRLVDNEFTFLEFADLVFIDPVGTGFSRAISAEAGKKYFGVNGDIASVGEFIRLYLTRHRRFQSPLYLVGESYGTFRAAGLGGYLIDRGIAFNGICLVSTILNFQTARFNKGNDLPYPLFLPTYTATAWYHKKLPADLQTDLKKALKESEDFAMNGYATALMKGDRLTLSEREVTVAKLARLTGLDKRWLDQNDLRPDIMRFIKELRRSEGVTVGRLDSRLVATTGGDGAEMPGFDPSNAAIRPPYTETFLDYVRGDLGYSSDLQYFILGGGIGPWDYGPGGSNAYSDTSEALRQAIVKNPYLKVYVGYGYYDLATPYFAAQYTLAHAGIPAKYKANFTERYYPAGHMYYIDKGSLAAMRKDIGEFVAASHEK